MSFSSNSRGQRIFAAPKKSRTRWESRKPQVNDFVLAVHQCPEAQELDDKIREIEGLPKRTERVVRS